MSFPTMCRFSPALPCPFSIRDSSPPALGRKGWQEPVAVAVLGWQTAGCTPQKAARPGPRDEQQMGTPPDNEMGTGQSFFSKLLPSQE